MAQEIHVGDIGTVLTVTIEDDGVVKDISTVTTKTLHLAKPDGSVVSKTAAYVTDGTDGKIQYTTVSGDIDMPGEWCIQAYIAWPDSTRQSSEKAAFKVYANLVDP